MPLFGNLLARKSSPLFASTSNNKSCSFLVISASVGEKRLSHDLFVTREYDRLIRPVENYTQSVNVSFNMELFQLIRIVSISLLSEYFTEFQ